MSTLKRIKYIFFALLIFSCAFLFSACPKSPPVKETCKVTFLVTIHYVYNGDTRRTTESTMTVDKDILMEEHILPVTPYANDKITANYTFPLKITADTTIKVDVCRISNCKYNHEENVICQD